MRKSTKWGHKRRKEKKEKMVLRTTPENSTRVGVEVGDGNEVLIRKHLWWKTPRNDVEGHE